MDQNLDGWTAEPVDHDPFADVPDSGVPATNAFASETNGFAGHIAATSDPAHPLTTRSLPFHGAQPSATPYQPSPRERIQQGVSEAAQSYGVPTQGAERLGSAAQFGADMTPGLGQALSAGEAVRSAQRGDFGGTVANLAGATPIPAILAGPLARTADHAMLAKAQEMAAAGASRDEIHEATKWFTNPKGQWQYEIPDTAAHYTEKEGMTTLGQALYHPDLYAAYPGLENTPLSWWRKGEEGGMRGSFWGGRQGQGQVSSAPGEMMLRQGLDSPSVPLHEAQHGVQWMERTPMGGTPKKPFEGNANYQIWQGHQSANLDKLYNDPPKNVADYGKFMRMEDPVEAAEDFQNFQRAHAFSRQVGKVTPNLESFASRKANVDYYLSHYGEAEARNVQNRLANAKAMGGYRYLDPPYSTMDTGELSMPPYADGGRVGFDGGSLEPVDFDPFASGE